MTHKIRFRILTSLCCFVLFFLSTAVYGQLWLETLDEQGNRLTKKQLHLYMMSHEFRALRFINHAENNGTTVDHRAFLVLKKNYPIPDYVFGWEDKDVLISPGERDSLENILYIHPKKTGDDTIEVYAGLRQGTSSYDHLIADQFTIYIHVTDSQYDMAKILPEPEFTSGLTNTVSWLSARNAYSQDAYFYDVDDPVYLFEAANGLYKAIPKDTLHASFEGLTSGNQYAYFVKSVFNVPGGKRVFYTDFTFSTQDNAPPDPIGAIQAIERFPGIVELSWGTVQDEISGVKAYRIYRGVDTGPETLIDSVMASPNDPDSLSWTETVTGNPTFYYRIRAVDAVGNEGEGAASNVIYTGDGGHDPNQSENTAEVGRWGTVRPIIPFPIDTLWITLDGRETSLRFQSVRDSVKFFENKPDLDFRYFDSNWIEPQNLEKDPLDPTRCFYIFDYTKNGQVYDQFVSGHTYHRRFIRNYTVSTDTFSLGQITPDLFAPDDISNLHVESNITDYTAGSPLESYYTWRAHLQWSPSEDPVSGLKRYHIYRMIDNVNNGFIELPLGESFLYHQYIDSVSFTPSDIRNPKVMYRVVAEDSVGHMRQFMESAWQGECRSLEAPEIVLTQNNPDLFIASGPDTIFTKVGTVIYQIDQFDISDIQHYIVSINGVETIHKPIFKDTLQVILPPAEVSEIQVRAIYPGNRSSIWSETRWAIRALNKIPINLSAKNDSLRWEGDLYIQWEKASLDLKYYEVWRASDGDEPILIGKSSDPGQRVRFTDYYTIDEITGESTTPLTAYQTYAYQVRQVNLFGDVSRFTDWAETRCIKPPDIISHSLPKIEEGRYVFTVTWKRPRPNLVSNNFQTLVRVFEDSLENQVHQAIITDNDTTFTFRQATLDHNYIFRVQERTNNTPQLKSAWSKPYTVSSLVKLEPFTVLPQPKGHIYLDWNSPAMIEHFKVDSFLVYRDETLLAGFPNTVISYMDSARYLNHTTEYTYSIFALDSLRQVVAANMKSGVSDTGPVYIPEILPFGMKYFNADSVRVNWTWRDIDGNAITGDTRGAKTYWLQSSVSIDFPEEANQTVTSGPHEASVTSQIIPVPPLGNEDNEQVYFRIRTEDAYGHPGEMLWSTSFYPVKKLIYDPVFPNLPSDMAVTASQAYYHGPDSVVVTLEWSGSGVEYPKNNDESIYWDALIQNIHSYTLKRTDGAAIEQVEWAPVNPQKAYVASDTMLNRQNKWQIVVTDSAGNQSVTGWFESQIYLPTPEPPVPLHHRGCTITPVTVSPGPAEYAVEMALNPDHFAFAYELDQGSQIDRFLCQSGWIAGPKFICTSGWGRIQVDSTWFRVKTGQEIDGQVWESGWSAPSLYNGSDDGVNPPEETEITQVPEHFYVRSNYPNPFNMSTTIEYGLSEETEFSASVFNMQGRKIKTLQHQILSPGYYSVHWDGTDSQQSPVATGIYIIQVLARSQSLPSYQNHMKVMLLK